MFTLFVACLSQITGNGFSNRGAVSPKVFVGWLFACYILMANLYQGSILSYLTVAIPSQVPNTLSELVDSNLWSLTVSFFRKKEGNWSTDYSYHSSLQETAIPSIISSWSDEHRYSKILAKFNKKLFFFPTTYISNNAHIAKNISNFLPILNKFNDSISTETTFAIFDKKFDLNAILESINILQKRFVIRSKEETHLNNMLLVEGRNNFLSHYINNGFRQFSQSGIDSLWKKIVVSKKYLYIMSKIGEKYRLKYFAKVLANAKDPIVFSESDPVSLKAIKYVIILCVTLSSVLGGVAFVVELIKAGQLLVTPKKIYTTLCRGLAFIMRQWKSILKFTFNTCKKCHG
jgi:hypothetical protein